MLTSCNLTNKSYVNSKLAVESVYIYIHRDIYTYKQILVHIYLHVCVYIYNILKRGGRVM